MRLKEQQANANIPLQFKITYDKESKMHFAQFILFPQVVVFDDSEEKAIQRLVQVFNEEVIKDRKDEFVSKLLSANNLQINVDR
ncbi:MAG TPA: hypothetical protein VF144_10790, partial [Chitinophagaceae bacterium]